MRAHLSFSPMLPSSAMSRSSASDCDGWSTRNLARYAYQSEQLAPMSSERDLSFASRYMYEMRPRWRLERHVMVLMKAESSVVMPLVASARVSTSSAAAQRISDSCSSRRKSHITASLGASPEKSEAAASVTASTPPAGSWSTRSQPIAAFAKLPPISLLSADASGSPYLRSYASSSPAIRRSSRPPSRRHSVPASVNQPFMALSMRMAMKSWRGMSSALRHQPSFFGILSAIPLRSDCEYLFSYTSASFMFCMIELVPMMSIHRSSFREENMPLSTSPRSCSHCSCAKASLAGSNSGARSPLSSSISSRHSPEYDDPNSAVT